MAQGKPAATKSTATKKAAPKERVVHYAVQVPGTLNPAHLCDEEPATGGDEETNWAVFDATSDPQLVTCSACAAKLTRRS